MSMILFALLFTTLSALIVFLGFKVADVSIENGVLFISTLFSTTRVVSKRYRKIGALYSFGYYLEFENGKGSMSCSGPAS